MPGRMSRELQGLENSQDGQYLHPKWSLVFARVRASHFQVGAVAYHCGSPYSVFAGAVGREQKVELVLSGGLLEELKNLR